MNVSVRVCKALSGNKKRLPLESYHLVSLLIANTDVIYIRAVLPF